MNTNENRLNNLKKISVFLDSQFNGPFGFRFGWDPIIGLIPFLGSLITRLISLYIVVEGVRLTQGGGFLFVKMLWNVFLEFLVENIPLLGLIFDAVFKANNRNIVLIENYLLEPQKTKRKLKIQILVAILLCLALFVGMLYISFKLIVFLLTYLNSASL